MGIFRRTHHRHVLGDEAAYRIEDRFLDPQAAGSLNGTPSTPGPGDRAVTDTDDNASITGDVFVVAGVVGNGDPALRYAAQTRTPGLTLIAKLNVPAVGGERMFFGWDGNQAGHVGEQAFTHRVGTIRIAEGPSEVIVSSASTAIYTDALVLRTVGAYFLVKAGAQGTWTLLWVSHAISTATQYPGVSAAGWAFNLYHFLLLDSPFMLPIDTYDTFTRANGVLGSSEVIGPDLQILPARTWESGGATWAIASNEAVNTPTEESEALTDPVFATACGVNWTCGAAWAIGAGVATSTPGSGSTSVLESVTIAETWYKIVWTLSHRAGTFAARAGGANIVDVTSGGVFTHTQRATGTDAGINSDNAGDGDVGQVSVKPLTLNTLFTDVDDKETSDYLAEVELDTVVATTQAGMVLNLDDASTPANFILAYHDGTHAKLDKCVAGVYTSVISAAGTYAAGARLVVHKQGTSYTLFYNNAKKGTTSTISDAGIISNTKHGLFSTYSGNQLDNFAIFYRTHPTYEELNRHD